MFPLSSIQGVSSDLDILPVISQGLCGRRLAPRAGVGLTRLWPRD